MASGAYVWSAHAEPYAAILRDPVSGRRAIIRRPAADRLPIDDLVRLERLALRWAGLPGQAAAQAELFGALDTDPLRVLNGMNWLLAYWAVLWDLRRGHPATDLIRALDYTGPWRETGKAPDAPEGEHVWQAITQRIRAGVLGQLTGEPRMREAYDAEVTRLAPDIFLHITLATVDGLSQDLMTQGLHLRGMASALAEHTGPGDGSLPPFGVTR
ncbi:MAG: hypothetical protein JWO67_1675 [Streptosporangiaceae bacterium]|jgi:hypothetical protein|nr:hypothetical protein [Streptosporangiaceae bacterium]